MDLNFKGEWYPIYGRKGHFQFGEKGQLFAIALINRQVLLKMVAMATSHSLLRYCFIALTPTVSPLFQNKI